MSISTANTLPVAIGIDVGGTKAKICAADMSGTILAITEIPTGSRRAAADVASDLRDGLHAVVLDAETVSGSSIEIRSAGLVTPGVVGPDGINLTPNNPGMDTVSSETFRRQLGLASLNWANDVKAAAMAEYQWGGLQGAKCGLYVNLGTGLSAGAVIQGEPLNGAHGAALEIGYLLPSTQYVPGHRSGAAPLEDLISGRALGERATRLCGQHLTATDVLATIESMSPAGNPQVGDLQLLAEEFIDHLCRAVVNLAISLDVDVISVGGGVAVASRSFLPALRAALDEYVPFPPKLTASPAPNDLSMRGALLLAYKAAGLGVPNLNQRSGPRPARYTTAAPAA